MENSAFIITKISLDGKVCQELKVENEALVKLNDYSKDRVRNAYTHPFPGKLPYRKPKGK